MFYRERAKTVSQVAGQLSKEKETANGKRKYVPVRVRFNTWSEQGETLFTKFIFPLVSPLQENTHPRQAISLGPDNIPETLWSVLKFSRPTPDTDFVLIFDQFEEFFTCQTFSKCQCISQGKTLCRCLACLHRSYATKPKATRKKRDEHPTQHHEKRKNTADFERNRDLGLFLIENKQYRAALRYLSDALRTKPDDSTLTNAMNECIFKTGQQ